LKAKPLRLKPLRLKPLRLKAKPLRLKALRQKPLRLKLLRQKLLRQKLRQLLRLSKLVEQTLYVPVHAVRFQRAACFFCARSRAFLRE
jgi:hypothetical protein